MLPASGYPCGVSGSSQFNDFPLFCAEFFGVALGGGVQEDIIWACPP
jgi:hypothetical protein